MQTLKLSIPYALCLPDAGHMAMLHLLMLAVTINTHSTALWSQVLLILIPTLSMQTMQTLSGGSADDQTSQLALSQQQQSLQSCKTSLPVAWPAVQAQPHEVNAVYATMVSRVKSVVDRLDRGGTGAQLDTELEKACLTLVGLTITLCTI